MFQTTNQNSSWCGYRSKMVKTWSKTDWQKWMGLTTKKDPSLWLHDPSPVGLRSLGLERNWQESTMFSNHEKVWDSYRGVLQYFHSSKSGIHHLHQCPTGRSSLPGSSCIKKKSTDVSRFQDMLRNRTGNIRKHRETHSPTKWVGPPNLLSIYIVLRNRCCPKQFDLATKGRWKS